MNKDIAKVISVWSDLGSMALLAWAILVGGLSPSRPIWGRSREQNVSLIASFLVAVGFSGFRVVVEGIFKDPGPRQFLVLTIVYIGRWIYLYWCLHRPDSKEARLFEVAHALRKLHMLRIGPSTEANRKKQWEIVRRRGVEGFSPWKPEGVHYWRGVKEHDDKFSAPDQCWYVRLVQEHLHADVLDVIGTIEYMNKDYATMEEAYRRFYKVVLTAVVLRKPKQQEIDAADGQPISASQAPRTTAGQQRVRAPTTSIPRGAAEISNAEDEIVPSGSTVTQLAGPQAPDAVHSADQGLRRMHPDREVDFSPFFAIWRGMRIEALAENVKATDVRPIGSVARRVAADAVAYVNDKRNCFRTEQQVRVVNECLKQAAMQQFPQLENLEDFFSDEKLPELKRLAIVRR